MFIDVYTVSLLATYLISDYLQHVAYSNRRRLRSSSSSLLLIPRTRLTTVGDRAFPVAGSRLMERSSTRRYVSSDSCCFPKAAQNLSFLSFVHVVTDVPRNDTPLSGLAVFD